MKIDFFTDTNVEQTFHLEIEDLVSEKNILYMDAVIEWASDRNIDLDACAKFISKNLPLKSKLQIEAENLHFLKKTPRLNL